jgi:hypothetical protein
MKTSQNENASSENFLGSINENKDATPDKKDQEDVKAARKKTVADVLKLPF